MEFPQELLMRSAGAADALDLLQPFHPNHREGPGAGQKPESLHRPRRRPDDSLGLEATLTLPIPGTLVVGEFVNDDRDLVVMSPRS